MEYRLQCMDGVRLFLITAVLTVQIPYLSYRPTLHKLTCCSLCFFWFLLHYFFLIPTAFSITEMLKESYLQSDQWMFIGMSALLCTFTLINVVSIMLRHDLCMKCGGTMARQSRGITFGQLANQKPPALRHPSLNHLLDSKTSDSHKHASTLT